MNFSAEAPTAGLAGKYFFVSRKNGDRTYGESKFLRKSPGPRVLSGKIVLPAEAPATGLVGKSFLRRGFCHFFCDLQCEYILSTSLSTDAGPLGDLPDFAPANKIMNA